MTTEITGSVATDARYRQAVHLAANAERIVAVPEEQAFLVPATEGGFYRVDADGCPCPDATYRHTLCKHQIAVAMLRIGAAAVELNATRLPSRRSPARGPARRERAAATLR